MSHPRRHTLLLAALVLTLLTGLFPAPALVQDGDPASVDARAAPDLTNSITLGHLGRYTAAGSEIAAYDPASKPLFVTGRALQILDLSNPAAPTLVTTVPIEATSVALRNGPIATAVDPGGGRDGGRAAWPGN